MPCTAGIYILYSCMQIFETNHLDDEQKEVIRIFWNKEYPVQLAYKTAADFDKYLGMLNNVRHYLLPGDDGTLEGWAFTFLRDDEKWFAIILDSKIHGQGKGTLLLNCLKEHESILNGWVIDHDGYQKQDGMPYLSPLRFYEKNDFVVCDHIRLETATLSAAKIVWRK